MEQYSEKSRMVAAFLCWIFGFFGLHRFYVGKIWTGILMILTIGGLGIWWFIDLIWILFGNFRDKEGKKVFLWFEKGSM